MKKAQQKNLQRLEEALLKMEEPEDDTAWVEERYPRAAPRCNAYNTDTTDVDLDAYSQQVLQGRKGSRLMPVICLLTLAAMCLIAWWICKATGGIL